MKTLPGSFFLRLALFILATAAVRTPAQTIWGNALSFNGNAQYVFLPAGSNWFGSEFTIETWVCLRSHNYWTRVVDFGNGAPMDNVVLCLDNADPPGTGKPCLAVFSPTDGPILYAPNPLPTNQWVHLAATFKTNWGSIYLNGVLVTNGPVAIPRQVNRTNNFIGKDNWNAGQNPNAIFDEMRIWKVARTEAEIAATMSYPLTGTEPNLVALWKFDEGSGSFALDSTTNHLDGRLTNGPSWTLSTVPIPPPAISLQPASQVVTPGQPGSLSVAVSSLGPVGYQWFKDGVMLAGQTGSNLTVGTFQLTNSGSYYVVATNAGGLAISLPAWLSLPNAPLKAWGDNDNGELGSGATSGTSLPISVASNVVAVAAGNLHSLFVKNDGTLWAMGLNDSGQLGNGTTSDTNLPISVASNVVALAAGSAHSLFVKNDGTLWAVGYNFFGQLGNGTTDDTNQPISVASNVVAVAAGETHSLFVKNDGTLWAMGGNGDGQLGNGTTGDTDLPISVASNVVAVAAGSAHSLFVKNDGTLWAMGWNGDGELGNGTTSEIHWPISVASNVVGVAAGDAHSLFVKNDGTLWAMGGNGDGQLGNGTTGDTDLPILVASNVVAVAAGYYHSLFVKNDGTLWAMGANGYGQLGNSNNTDQLWPVNVPGLTVASLGAMGAAYHSLAVAGVLPQLAALSNRAIVLGQPFTFSAVVAGGDGPLTYQWQLNGTNIADATNTIYSVASAALANAGTYGVTVTGLFGSASASANLIVLPIPPPAISLQPASQVVTPGQPGSLSVAVSSPVPVGYQWFKDGVMLAGQTGSNLTVGTFRLTNSGSYYVVATNAAGMVISLPTWLSLPNAPLKAWGRNDCGQLGNGTTSDTNLPISVASNVVALAACYLHSLFVKNDGTLWAMGDNEYGQLGNGTRSDTNLPISVASNVVAAAAGLEHSLFVKNDGTLWAMGDNDYGQLGNDRGGYTNRPISVASNVVAVAAGYEDSLFVKNDGTLWAMGDNEYGQLGNGTTGEIDWPISVASNVVAVAIGYEHSLFVKNDGTLWAMGDNFFGQLGNGTTSGTHLPISVASNVVAAAAGLDHSLFVKNDGTLWAMGDNYFGELGNGTTSGTHLPIWVASNVVAVAAGYGDSLFVKNDGTLWAMGDNDHGQLGNGTNANQPWPVNVTELTVASLGGMGVACHSLAVGSILVPPVTITTTDDRGPGSLRDALASAADGDTVDATHIAGTITLTSGELDIVKSLTLLGPGPGALTVSGNRSSRVFNVTGANVTLSGLTIANGYITNANGAGLYAGGGPGSRLTLTDCVVTNNSTTADGGGIYSQATVTTTISNCTLCGNSASAWGGGIYNHGGDSGQTAVMTLSASVVTNNNASRGGGIVNLGGWWANAQMTISNCVISGNTAYGWGGGIFNDAESSGDANLSISFSTLSGNWAGDRGGGIDNNGSSQGQAHLTVNTTTLSGNTAAAWGGGIFNDGEWSGYAKLQLFASTLSGNWAGDRGGGIDSDSYSQGVAELWIVDSTLSGNATANLGGGIFNDGYASSKARVVVSASTFSGNSATVAGGGIYNLGQLGAAVVEIGDTILNAGASGANLFNDSGTVQSDGYNLSSDRGSGFLTQATDIVGLDPKLGLLQDNGGPTRTHALLPGSPAIDKGNGNAVTSVFLSADQRDLARPVDLPVVTNAAGGDGSDIGAFELQSLTLSGNPPLLTGAGHGGDGSFQFGFTDTTGARFTVFTATNVALPFSNWTMLGMPVEIAPGQFQFTDSQATNRPRGFYRVTSP